MTKKKSITKPNYYQNESLFIVGKTKDNPFWTKTIDKAQIPTTISFQISSFPFDTSLIKKINWEFGDKAKIYTITHKNKKTDILYTEHIYKKPPKNLTTLIIQVSVYTPDSILIPTPLSVEAVHKKKKNYVDPVLFKTQIIEFYETGNLTDQLAISVQEIANRLAFAPNFINYCVDKETEALTQRGWLKYNQITKDDIILSYDIKKKQLTWSSIKNIYINNYKGKMFQLTTKGLDALVTPHHKFVTRQNGIEEVEYLKCGQHVIINGKPVKDEERVYTATNEIYNDELVELVGWAVTEGNYVPGKKTHSLQIFQKQGIKAERIRNCLNKLKIPYKVYNWTNPEILGFRFNKEYANLIVNKLAPNKILSMNFILSLTQKQRLLLIQTMVDGDGCTAINKNGTIIRSYVQKNKQHIDSFIALCTLAGITTSVTYVKNTSEYGKGSYYYTVNIFSKAKTTCKINCIDFHGGRSKAGGDQKSIMKGKKNKPNIPTVDYDGIVWCPETEYKTFVCRRGKYVYVTGNSYREEMTGDAIVKMIKALREKKFLPEKGNPFSYFTKIAFHAFCNRIKREKKLGECGE